MEDLGKLDGAGARSVRYEQAVASMEAEKLGRAARGHAVMATVMGYGEASTGTGTFGRISHVAKLFCIGFAFLVPSLLMWRVVL